MYDFGAACAQLISFHCRKCGARVDSVPVTWTCISKYLPFFGKIFSFTSILKMLFFFQSISHVKTAQRHISTVSASPATASSGHHSSPPGLLKVTGTLGQSRPSVSSPWLIAARLPSHFDGILFQTQNSQGDPELPRGALSTPRFMSCATRWSTTRAIKRLSGSFTGILG